MSAVFENTQVEIRDLPHIGQVNFRPLEKDYLKVSLVATLIFWAIIAIGASMFLIFNDLNYPNSYNHLGTGLVGILFLFSLWMVQKGFTKKAFALRQRDILYKKGVFWKSLTTVPFNRVQHCEVKEGPIDRMFNLSQLNIYTAGGSQSDLTIPGLKPDDAKDLKNYIIGKTGYDESE